MTHPPPLGASSSPPQLPALKVCAMCACRHGGRWRGGGEIHACCLYAGRALFPSLWPGQGSRPLHPSVLLHAGLLLARPPQSGRPGSGVQPELEGPMTGRMEDHGDVPVWTGCPRVGQASSGRMKPAVPPALCPRAWAVWFCRVASGRASSTLAQPAAFGFPFFCVFSVPRRTRLPVAVPGPFPISRVLKPRAAF